MSMTESAQIFMALFGGIGSAAYLVWKYRDTIEANKDSKIKELEGKIEKLEEADAYKTEIIIKLVTALKYSDAIKTSDSINQLVDEIIAEFASKRQKLTV